MSFQLVYSQSTKPEIRSGAIWQSLGPKWDVCVFGYKCVDAKIEQRDWMFRGREFQTLEETRGHCLDHQNLEFRAVVQFLMVQLDDHLGARARARMCCIILR